MAQKTVVTFVDDLDGESEAEGTVPFALDGVQYEIDLTGENADDLREIFAPYISAARRTGGRKPAAGRSRGSASTASGSTSGPVARSREALKAIREWAKGEGWAVSDRGRLPNNVVEAYDAAHK